MKLQDALIVGVFSFLAYGIGRALGQAETMATVPLSSGSDYERGYDDGYTCGRKDSGAPRGEDGEAWHR